MMKRFDGRDWNEIRKMEAKIGISENCEGSAYFRFGNTIAYAFVYGPKQLKILDNVEEGVLRVRYSMLPFSTPERKKSPVSRREVELSTIIKRVIKNVLVLKEIPGTVTDIDIKIISADAGTRTAAINAAILALADAGIPMKDLAVAVAVGKVGQRIVIDLNKMEEDYNSEKLVGTEYEKYIEYYGQGTATDIPVAILPSEKKIIMLQLDGSITEEELKRALDLAMEKSFEIKEVFRKAILEKYPEDKKL